MPEPIINVEDSSQSEEELVVDAPLSVQSGVELLSDESCSLPGVPSSNQIAVSDPVTITAAAQ